MTTSKVAARHVPSPRGQRGEGERSQPRSRSGEGPLTPTLSPLRGARKYTEHAGLPSQSNPMSSKHQVFVLQPEHHAAPAAADIFVLIGDMLPAGHEIGENSAEREIIRKPGGAGRLEDARGKERAALRHLSRLEFVAQALLERRHVAGPGIGVQVAQVAMQRVRHLVDGGRALRTDELHERIFGGASSGPRHARLAVIEKRVEHALQGAERSGGNAAHENLPERQPVEARPVKLPAGAIEPAMTPHALRAISGNERVLDDDVPAAGRLQARYLPGGAARIGLARQKKNAPPGPCA